VNAFPQYDLESDEAEHKNLGMCLGAGGLVEGIGAVEGAKDGDGAEDHLVAVGGDGDLGGGEADAGGVAGFPALPRFALAGVDIELGDFDALETKGAGEDVIRVGTPADGSFAGLNPADRTPKFVLDGEGAPSAILQDQEGVPVGREDGLQEFDVVGGREKFGSGAVHIGDVET